MRFKGVIIGVLSLVYILTSCSASTVKVGFIGDMASKNSQLAVDIRNAVELGMNQINEDGGIRGRKLELVIKDDGSDYDKALEAHEAFMDEEVNFVIGHVTSNMAEAAKISQNEQLMFLSPTMSTDSLTGIDDYILRTSPINSNQGHTLADYFAAAGIDEIAVVYDMMNAEYAENLYIKIVELSDEHGYEVNFSKAFNSRSDDLQLVSEEVYESGIEDVLFISQATDTAFMMQYLKQRNPQVKGCSVSWSMTQDLIQNGGKNVQGMYFVGLYKPEVNTVRYKAFFEAFKEVYGYEPSFASVLGYDSIMTLAEGMKESSSFTVEDVKSSIIEIGEFTGLQEVFGVDMYGDNSRQYLMYKLNDGDFQPQWD